MGSIFILGGTGFIGRNLTSELKKSSLSHNIFLINRNCTLDSVDGSLTDLELRENLSPDSVVINLASAAKSSAQTIIDANFTFPKKILDLIMNSKIQVNWIQASSYYQCYRKLYEVDKDLYSREKDRFLTLLRSRDSITVQNYYFPHVFGPGEDQRRLIPSLLKARSEGRMVHLSSGRQILPCINVSWLVRELVDCIVMNIKKPEYFFIPRNLLSVEEIAKLVFAESLGLLNFGTIVDRENEFYSKFDLQQIVGYGHRTKYDFTLDAYWMRSCS